MTKVARLSDRERGRTTYRVQYSDKGAWMLALGVDARLTPAEVRVGIVLCGYINARSGRAWPTVATLAAAAVTSDSSTKRALRKLELLGLIAVHRKGGRGNPNYYELRFDRLADTAEKGVTDEPLSSAKGVSEDRKGVQNRPEKGVTGDPQIRRKEINKTRACTREADTPPPDREPPAKGCETTPAPTTRPPPVAGTGPSAGKRAEFIATTDPRWQKAAEAHHRRTGKPPMTVRLHGREGWMFPVELIDGLEPMAAGPS